MKVLNIPGWKNSDEGHWQSIWEASDPSRFQRIEQDNWLQPTKDAWVPQIAKAIKDAGSDIIVTAHSVGITAFLMAVKEYNLTVKGALLVAPSDTESPGYPEAIQGFTPIPTEKLPFYSIVVASTTDPAVQITRATEFAINWGSRLHILKDAGHIETKSGYGDWLEGLRLLKMLGVNL